MTVSKRAAELRRGDGVHLFATDYRVVEAVEFTDKPIDSSGTTGVRVRWFGSSRPSLLAVDKELTVDGDDKTEYGKEIAAYLGVQDVPKGD